MKKKLLILLLIFLTFRFTYGTEKQKYIGVNIGPAVLSRDISVVYEHDISPFLTAYTCGGVVFNATMGSMLKCNDGHSFDLRSGASLKAGIKTHFNSQFTPFVGAYLINGLSYEKGFFKEMEMHNSPSVPFNKVGYNLGLAASIGLSTELGKRIKVDFGIQSGSLLVNNLSSIQSYAPGMGINFGTLNFQWILELKYRL